MFLLLRKDFNRYENSDVIKVIMALIYIYIVDVIGRIYSKSFIFKSRRVLLLAISVRMRSVKLVVNDILKF